jgi:hypothetical protein
MAGSATLFVQERQNSIFWCHFVRRSLGFTYVFLKLGEWACTVTEMRLAINPIVYSWWQCCREQKKEGERLSGSQENCLQMSPLREAKQRLIAKAFSKAAP